MEDEKMIELYWERNEAAISETSSKCGKLFFRIASNILLNHEDSEECVNGTYFGLWNAILFISGVLKHLPGNRKFVLEKTI